MVKDRGGKKRMPFTLQITNETVSKCWMQTHSSDGIDTDNINMVLMIIIIIIMRVMKTMIAKTFIIMMRTIVVV